MLRFLLLFFISPAVFAYCPNIDLTTYPEGTPTTICVDYMGENCEAKCSWNAAQQIGICVANSGVQGPYVLTGNSCTPSGGDSGGTGTGGTTDPQNPASGATDTGGGSSGGDSGIIGSDDSVIGYYYDQYNIKRQINLKASGLKAINTSLSAIEKEVKLSGDNIGSRLNSISEQLSQVTMPLSEIKNNVSSIAENESSSAESLRSLDGKFSVLNSMLENKLSEIADNTKSNSDTSIEINNNIGQFFSGYSRFLQQQYTMLDSRLSSLSGVSPSTPSASGAVSTDLTGVIDSIETVNSSIRDVDGDLKGLKSSVDGDFLASHSIGEKQIQRLDSLIDAVKAGGSGSGSGGGEGSGSGPSVGTAENPSHVASSLYKSCADCVVDIAGAESELAASKEKLKALNKTIQTEFQSFFKLDFGSGSGSSAIESCWDFGELIGQKCMQLDETWAVLKGLVLFIFVIAIIFMFTRGD